MSPRLGFVLAACIVVLSGAVWWYVAQRNAWLEQTTEAAAYQDENPANRDNIVGASSGAQAGTSESGLVVEANEAPSSWEELLATVDAEERRYLTEMNERLFGALFYTTAEQRAWLQRNGYLLAEDMLAMREMSDDELAEMAARGVTKAKMLLSVRKTERVANLMDQYRAGEIKQPVRELAEGNRYLIELATLPDPSPFVGFLRANWKLNAEADVNEGLAGLAFALTQGDTRATGPIARLAEDYPDVDVASVLIDLSSITAMLQTQVARGGYPPDAEYLPR